MTKTTTKAKLTQWELTLEDGTTVVSNRARHAPKWVATQDCESRPTRRTGEVVRGLGYVVEYDPTRAPIKYRKFYAFDLRRHAVEACRNERWAVGGMGEFAFSELSARHVLRVVAAEPITPGRWAEARKNQHDAHVIDSKRVASLTAFYGRSV